jgi:glycosyltransferase involved in cell wall biosynthesis
MTAQPRKIHLLYVLDSLAVGGAEQLVRTMAVHLPQDRFHVVVCTLFSRGERPEPLADELRAQGIRTEQFAMKRWRDTDTIRRFWRLIEEERIDMVHGHTVPADFWGCFLARLLKPFPLIYTRHDRFRRPGRAMRLQRLLLDHVLADVIVSISAAVTAHLIEDCRVSPDRIVQIPNPVDTDRFRPDVSGAPVREALGIPQDALVVGNVSRFELFKGYDYFLDIAAAMVPRYPALYFLMVGHGPERDRLLARIEALGLQGRVVLTGPRRDIPDVMGAIDIFLFTSLWGEGFGIVLIEAMAAGKAIVAANTGPAREIIEEGVSGYLPAPAAWVPETATLDIHPFVERIEYFLRHPEHRERMGRAARQRAVERFSVSGVADQTVRLYTGLYRSFYGSSA